MSIRDFMPVLSRGGHNTPEEGACVMEYVSILAGEEFDDFPKCTHPTLARAAQHVNDILEDKHRHLLIPLITKLIGTGELTGQAAFDDWEIDETGNSQRFIGFQSELRGYSEALMRLVNDGFIEFDAANERWSHYATERLDALINSYWDVVTFLRGISRPEEPTLTKNQQKLLLETVSQG